MTAPISYRCSTIIERPADEVWAYVVDKFRILVEANTIVAEPASSDDQ